MSDLDPGPDPGRITLRRRVEWSDTDASGHHHNATVIRWVEAAEAAMHEAMGILPLTFGMTPRVHYEVDFTATVAFWEPVDIELAVIHVGRTSARYSFEIRRRDATVATGWYAVAHVPRGSKSAEPWPAAVREALRERGRVAG